MFVISTNIIVMMALLNNNMVGSAADRHSDCILVMGGGTSAKGKLNPAVEFYHPDDHKDCHLSHLFQSVTWHKASYRGSGCYLADREQIVLREHKHEIQSSTIYWLRNGSTTKIPIGHNFDFIDTTSASMGSSRCLSCGGVYNGVSAKVNFRTAECYKFDGAINGWISIADYPQTVVAAASVSLGEYYYVIGGEAHVSHHNKITNQLHRYVSSGNSWEEMRPMKFYRKDHSAARLSDDKFITCGGIGGFYDGARNRLASCEVYSVASNNWQDVGEMLEKRSNFQMVNFNGRVIQSKAGSTVQSAEENFIQIFALGGYVSTTLITNGVEEYDINNRFWSKVDKPLKAHRCSFVAFAVAQPRKPTTTTAPPTVPPTHRPTTHPPTTHLSHQWTTNSQTAVTAHATTSSIPTTTSSPSTMSSTKISNDAENADSHKENRIPNATATTTAGGFDVRIIWIILLTIGGIIFIILGVVILCVSWKKGYFSKNSKSKKPKHQPIPFDWDDEHGSKIPRDPKMKVEEKSVSQATTTDDSQMTTTTDDDMTMTMTEDERTMRSAASATGGSVTEPMRKKR